MRISSAVGFLAAALSFAAGGPLQGSRPQLRATEAKAPDKDELPAGAVARLGGMSFRLGGWKKHLAFLDDDKLICCSEGGIRIWDRMTGKTIRAINPKFSPQLMQLTADRLRVVAGGRYLDKEVRENVFLIECWNVADGTKVWTVEAPFKTFAVTPDGKQLLVSEQGNLTAYELKAGGAVEQLDGVGEPISALAISPDGKHLAMATERNKAFLWAWTEADSAPVQISKVVRVTGLAFSPDGRWLALGPDSRKSIQLFDTVEKQMRQLSDDDAPLYVENLEFSPESQMLYAANAVRLSIHPQVSGVPCWDVETGKRIKRYTIPHNNPRSLAISPSGKFLAASGWNAGLHIWDVETGEVVCTGPEGHVDGITQVAFIPGTDQVVTISQDETQRVWQATTGQELRNAERSGWVSGLAVSHDGQLAATSAHDDEIHIWRTADGNVLHRLQGYGRLGGRHYLAFTGDDKQLVTFGGSMNALRIWDVQSGEMDDEFLIFPDDPLDRRETMPELSAFNWRIALSRDATLLVVATPTKLFRYHVSNGGDESGQFDLQGRVYDLALSPDGKSAVFAEKDGPDEEIPLKSGGVWSSSAVNQAIILRDIETGQAKWKFPVPDGAGGPLAFSADGKLIAAAIRGESNRAVILEAATGKAIITLDDVNTAWGGGGGFAFSPDNHWLAGIQTNSTVLIWDLPQLLKSRK